MTATKPPREQEQDMTTTTRQIYPAHYTDVTDPHPWPQPRACGYPRPALRVSASEPVQGRRLIGLSCAHLELGPLFDQLDDETLTVGFHGRPDFDVDPIDLKGAEDDLLDKLIDAHLHYLPADACDFNFPADRAHRFGAEHRADDALPVQRLVQQDFRES